ncbi:baseplate J/gp47 family protein [Photobacterium sp. WH24]|uniref:baseplate J/gp47 family protein n=1 Tax=Photobacterium sp. WH24 TaxID=2827237 RepID=UPI001C452F6E|nr:baseplate J/gp47 family protein [Photobacterium sp. WH24]MBV7262554.1 baseplate J/gp47 family protein [Photobacterium sp. WH24]
MPYNAPSMAESIRQLEGDIALELGLESELPFICSERAIAFAVGAAKRDIHDHIDWLAKQIVPSSESDEQTIVEKAAYEGVPRKLAKKASGPASIPASAAAVMPLDAVLKSDSGQRYVVTEAQLPENGAITFMVLAEQAGSAGNLAAGEVLTLVSPVPGVEAKATAGDISGGSDLEPVSELLGRLYFRKQNPPMGGALHDYIAWATEVGGVTRAWSYDMYQGGSTVGLTFVCDGEPDIIPTDNKITEVDTYIYRHADPATGELVGRPGGIELILFKLRLKTIQLSIDLTPDTGETRAAVVAQLKGLERAYAKPGSTILLSQVRTAIGTAQGVTDYQCTLNADITSAQDELITFGVPAWL